MNKNKNLGVILDKAARLSRPDFELVLDALGSAWETARMNSPVLPDGRAWPGFDGEAFHRIVDNALALEQAKWRLLVWTERELLPVP